ncbi:Hypothetical predicted protein, partial [Paramuricea clavata]
MKRNASKRKEPSTSETALVGESSKKKQTKSPQSPVISSDVVEESAADQEFYKKPSVVLAEHLGMKLDYSIPPHKETDMTYKKFLRIVHKQIGSANAGFPNSKIIALVGAAWKDCKAETQEKNIIEETSGKSESNPAAPEVESEIKPEGKKVGKKKRLIAPIQIKLTKMPVSQKLHKSLEQSDDSNNKVISESEELPVVKKLKNCAVQELGDDTDRSSDAGSTSSRSKKRKKNLKKKNLIEIDSGDEETPKKKKTKINEKTKAKKGKKKVVKRRRLKQDL